MDVVWCEPVEEAGVFVFDGESSDSGEACSSLGKWAWVPVAELLGDSVPAVSNMPEAERLWCLGWACMHFEADCVDRPDAEVVCCKSITG